MATSPRDRTAGAAYFFTLATHARQPVLATSAAVSALREAMRRARAVRPFQVLACAVLPDHLHVVWRLPHGDIDHAARWARVRSETERRLRARMPGPACPGMRVAGLWQRRIWGHRIRNDADLRRHVAYIHFNPVRHGLVRRVRDWPHSSFHAYVARGLLAEDWAAEPVSVSGFGPD